MIGRGLMRGPIPDDVRKWAFILMALLLIVVGAAAVRNFIESRSHAGPGDRHFDAARDFRKVNAKGMVNVLMKKPSERTRSDE